jgi:phospholipid/cholesterol/gamma-HCH transport system substrate-binding protein
VKSSKPFIIGVTFILAIIIFIWGFNYLKGRDLFKKQKFLYARYHTVNGLVTAKPVYINGLRVGQVNKLYFAPDMSGDVIVELLIQTKFPIPKNTVAHIFSADLMGSKSVTLKLGDSPEIAQNGDTLKTSVERSLMEEVNKQVKPIKAKAEVLLGSIDTLIDAFNAVMNEASRKNLESSIKNLRTTIKNLTLTSQHIDNMVEGSVDHVSSIIENIDSLMFTLNKNRGGFSNIVSNLSQLTDSLSKSDFVSTVNNINKSLTNINDIMAKINNGSGTLGKLVNNDSLYTELNKSAAELNKLLLDIREHPKKYVKLSLF